MKKTLVFVLGVCLLAMFAGTVSARDIDRDGKQIVRDLRGTNLLMDNSVPGYYEAAAVDTYNIVKFDFEVNNWMGWTTTDHTAQVDTFWHVTNFGGLGGGSYGLLVPIDGSYSMWCGTEPVEGWTADPLFEYLCGWKAAPGYGNNWDQVLESEEVAFEGTLSISFHGVFNNEGYGYDQCYLEYWNDATGEWVEAFEFGGFHDTIAVYGVDSIDVDGVSKFRFHFTADGAWSDQDGLYNTDGGAIVDSITVWDSGSYSNFEGFETAGEGAHAAGIWQASTTESFGIYSHMQSGMIAPDPCSENFGTQVVFTGTTEQADQTLYPGLYVTPRCLNPVAGDYPQGPCQAEGIISPFIVMTKYSTNIDENQDADIPSSDQDEFGGVLFRFTVYRDLPLDNLVFYTWGVRNVVNECPGSWEDRGYVYYGPDKDYLFTGNIVSDLVSGPNDTLQLNFGVQDMCAVWGGYYGTCTNHSPSPWFDNIRIQRTRTSGPQYAYRHLDIFQDNFPPTADVNGYVRADAANDVGPSDETWMINPGDSSVIEVSSPTAASGGNEEGIKVVGGKPAVYMHVKCTWEAPGTPPGGAADTVLVGSQLIGSNDSWMSYISDDGLWTKLQGDTARIGDPGNRGTALPNYMFDLNDSLFTKGYVIEYYFSAEDDNSEINYLPSNALEGGAFEFACLPLENNEILFVDDFDGRGSWDGAVQSHLDPALEAVLADGYPDRYDMNAPSSLVGNGVSSRTDATNLGLFYNTIIWDSGDLDTGTIGNGTSTSDEADDVAMLESWATDAVGHNHKTNLLVMGDGLVEDLTNVGATSLMTNVLGVALGGGNYFEETGGRTAGGVITPLITPVTGSYFDGLDDFWAFGGCPIVNQFDFLLTSGSSSEYGLAYPDYDGNPYYAMVYNPDTTLNDLDMKAVTVGFSFMAIRDANDDGAPVKNEFLKKVWEFFANGVNSDITDGGDPSAKFATKLDQNYPNPFNPTTRIEFSLKTRSHVTLRVYDVSGRLVRTLVDGVRDAGENRIDWKGINDRGANVASGVYFYKMNTKDFSDTKKMILLR
jgi:hypothetical protein